jgi:hypothetical protein
MKYEYQFTNNTEKQNIINAHKDKYLIEEDHHIDGNYLIFSDIKPIDAQLQNIQNNTDMILLKQEGII